MKQLPVTWDGVRDATGYLFSLAKSLSAAVKHSPHAALSEDVVATSGFAFRMWVSPDLCPSATSIWEFGMQKQWVENSGLTCGYVGRYWGEEAVEEQRRLEAAAMIRQSIDSGIPAVSWDIGVPEWGLITGYNDDAQAFSTLAINKSHADPTSPDFDAMQMPYDLLGKRELPILSVLTITGLSDKPRDAIVKDTLRMASLHLRGYEWCSNAKGLEAYPALIRHFEEESDIAASWNAEYFLGTYAALKEYAYLYFAKVGLSELAELYRVIFESWLAAFRLKTNGEMTAEKKAQIASLLKTAQEKETAALEVMEALV